MTTTERATTRCVVEHHDHHADAFDDPDASTCADCGEPVHYDERADDYRHDDTEHECFLHRGGDGCSLVELTWRAWARSRGLGVDDALDHAAGIEGLWIVQRTTGRTAFEHELHGETIEITCRGVDLLDELTMHDGGGYADAGLWAVLS